MNNKTINKKIILITSSLMLLFSFPLVHCSLSMIEKSEEILLTDHYSTLTDDSNESSTSNCSPPPSEDHSSEKISLDEQGEEGSETENSSNSDQSAATSEKDPIEQLTERLDPEFTQLFYRWITRADYEYQELSLPYAFLLFALERCPLSWDKQRRAKIERTDQNTLKEKMFHAISIILAYNLVDTKKWNLLPRHRWAREVFRLAACKDVQEAIKDEKKWLEDGFYAVLLRPRLFDTERLDLFFYCSDPIEAGINYARGAFKKKYTGDAYQQTPLFWAVLMEHEDVLKEILDAWQAAASSRRIQVRKHELNRRDNQGRTAIDYACRLKRKGMIDLLLDNDSKPQDATIRHMVAKGSWDCIKVLLSHEITQDWDAEDARDHAKSLLMHLAKCRARNEQVMRAIKAGRMYHMTELLDEVKNLPDYVYSHHNDGVVAGLMLLALKGYCDHDNHDESAGDSESDEALPKEILR